MNHAQVRVLVADFVRDVNPDAGADLPTESTWSELGVDSLSLVDLLFKLERELGVSIPDEVLPGITTVGGLMAHVAG
ncbi:acyl carrier protein [Kutzneria sp. 744]|uniref:acyl carrier protein n=1 Tax=Kutzneria sp. (strain 744) TaxID=345341 RepID=UPI0003EED636|nr:acyl carrier protein [Kutzneria sp. 744]EWM19078.1 acyl carrier protein [Kutzneria sp. 744]